MTRSRSTKAVLAVALVLALVAAGIVTARAVRDPSARSVILVNGDGMGPAQRQAATLALEGFEGELEMDQLPVRGSQSTGPDDPEATVTDSAAAATAWATGTRTANRRISTTRDGEPLTPLGRRAREAGKATGLVTTASVTDASPAAFFASVPDRGEHEEIAAQYLDRGRPDVVLGGGRFAWSEDLREQADRAGYDVMTEADELAAADGDRLLGLFADRDMWVAADEPEQAGSGDTGDGADPAEGGEEAPVAAYDPPVSLAEMTGKALDTLSRDDDGFFLIVEEEAVDGMGHAHNGTLMLEAMRALDEAVAVAEEYVAEHPDTLLVVTGDHEAGGLTVEDFDGGGEDGPFDVEGSDRQFALDWTSDEHTGVPTPVTAEGPGSERLAGSYPNTWLHTVMRDALLGP